MKTKLTFRLAALTALCGASAFAPRASAQDAAPAPTTPTQAAPDIQVKPEDQPPYFPDVPRNHWAYDAVQRLAAAGIIVGRPAPVRRAPKIADAVTKQMRSASWLGDAAYAQMLRLRLARVQGLQSCFIYSPEPSYFEVLRQQDKQLSAEIRTVAPDGFAYPSRDFQHWLRTG